jgi:hypothetical protein
MYEWSFNDRGEFYALGVYFTSEGEAWYVSDGTYIIVDGNHIITYEELYAWGGTAGDGGERYNPPEEYEIYYEVLDSGHRNISNNEYFPHSPYGYWSFDHRYYY